MLISVNKISYLFEMVECYVGAVVFLFFSKKARRLLRIASGSSGLSSFLLHVTSLDSSHSRLIDKAFCNSGSSASSELGLDKEDVPPEETRKINFLLQL